MTLNCRTEKLNRLFIKILILAFSLLWLPHASGQTTFEWNATNPYWDSNIAWSPLGPPGGSDNAHFTLNVTDTVVWDDITANQATGNLRVYAGDYTFDGTSSTQYTLALGGIGSAFSVNGSSTVLTLKDLHIHSHSASAFAQLNNGATFNLDGAGTAGAQFTVAGTMSNYGNFNLMNGAIANLGNINLGGQISDGVLDIIGGSIVSNHDATLGSAEGSTGTVNVSGTGSTWNTSGSWNLGNNQGAGSTGNLNVSSGGQVLVGDTDPGHAGTHIHIGSTGPTANAFLLRGTVNNAGFTSIGGASMTSGYLRISGSSSVWDTSSSFVGFDGTGTLEVLNGGIMYDTITRLGWNSGGMGSMTVSNAGSQLNNDSEIYAGYEGVGSITVSDSGVVNGVYTYLGRHSSGDGTLLVTGTGSEFNLTNRMYVGQSGAGLLNIEAGGKVTNADGHVGVDTGSSGIVNISGNGSRWVNNNSLTIGSQSGGLGELNISNFGRIHIGDGTFSGAGINVSDTSGATLEIFNGIVNNNKTSMTGDVEIGRDSGFFGTAIVSGSSAVWNNTGQIRVGVGGQGSLYVQNGAILNNDDDAFIGLGGIGNAFVDSNGQWNCGDVMLVGTSGPGTLVISGGGDVFNGIGRIGSNPGGNGTVTVDGAGSTWNNNNVLYVGDTATATLNILSGGFVSNTFGYIGNDSTAFGSVLVDGSGSTWDNLNDLYVGINGTGSLTIQNNGMVKVGGTTYLGGMGTVNLDGGRLEFGTMSWDDFNDINRIDGSMAGMLSHAGYTHVNALTTFHAGGPVDISDVNVVNSGTLYGEANLGGGVVNTTSGEIETLVGERMRFVGSGDNSGEFNNFGGEIRFEGAVTNNTDGFITGRGQFIANGGWINNGVMAFSGGFSDVVGDVNNDTGGQIVTAGNSTTTFYDDVVHNGVEIHTDAGSSTVFFGAASGAGNYTGAGTVFYKGDLRPGNSPDVVHYEGSVSIGSAALTIIELEGLNEGEFDKLDIDGDLSLNGTLQVDLLNGYQLGWNQEYLFAEVDGMRTGTFSNFGEGDLIGNYGGLGLFITYQAGDGNDVALWTAIPEPGTAWMLGVVGLVAVSRRRRGR